MDSAFCFSHVLGSFDFHKELILFLCAMASFQKFLLSMDKRPNSSFTGVAHGISVVLDTVSVNKFIFLGGK